MKTLEALMEEIKGSEEMQKEFWALNSKEAMDAFFKKHDCEAVTEDFAAFMQAAYEKFKAEQAEGEISDDAAEAVAGGGLREFIESVVIPIPVERGTLAKVDDKVSDFFTETLADAFSVFSTGGFFKNDPSAKRTTPRGAKFPVDSKGFLPL